MFLIPHDASKVAADSDGEPCLIACIEHVRGEMIDLAIEHAPVVVHQMPALKATAMEKVQDFTPEEANGVQGAEAGWTFHPTYPKYGQRLIHFDAESADSQYEVAQHAVDRQADDTWRVMVMNVVLG